MNGSYERFWAEIPWGSSGVPVRVCVLGAVRGGGGGGERGGGTRVKFNR